MLYHAKIGPLLYLGRPSGPQYVDVLVNLKDGALQTDLEDEDQSEVLRFLKEKRIKRPDRQADLDALLAFVCAQDAASIWTSGDGSGSDIAVHPTQQQPPDRPADYSNTKYEAWYKAITGVLRHPYDLRKLPDDMPRVRE